MDKNKTKFKRLIIILSLLTIIIPFSFKCIKTKKELTSLTNRISIHEWYLRNKNLESLYSVLESKYDESLQDKVIHFTKTEAKSIMLFMYPKYYYNTNEIINTEYDFFLRAYDTNMCEFLDIILDKPISFTKFNIIKNEVSKILDNFKIIQKNTSSIYGDIVIMEYDKDTFNAILESIRNLTSLVD